MCRSILPLRVRSEPTYRADIEASALQYVRKIVAIASPVSRQRIVPSDELERQVTAIADAAEALLRAAGCEVTREPPQAPAPVRARARERARRATG